LCASGRRKTGSPRSLRHRDFISIELARIADGEPGDD
jgi:hypothetical protein